MGFRTLRVLNDDIVAPGTGFGMHPHREMEILTWVLSGELAHRDSLGNGATLRPGMVQRMTAGRGLAHSEKNPSLTDPVHLLQIWIVPSTRGLTPTYEDRAFAAEGRRNRWQLLASPDGADGSLVIAQRAWMRVADLEPGSESALPVPPGAGVWLQVARGSLHADDLDLAAGDALAIDSKGGEFGDLKIVAREPSQVLAFTLM
jgi:quercetin 2,3-dioxygenase